jgi:GTP cyclohydrolase II
MAGLRARCRDDYPLDNLSMSLTVTHQKTTRLPSNAEMIAVERLISEIRSGRPVLIRDKNQLLLAASIEILSEELAKRLDMVAEGQASLLLPAARLRRLGLEREASGRIALPKIDLARIDNLALRLDARIDAPVMNVTAIERAALDLAALALILPAMLIIPLNEEPHFLPDLLEATQEAISQYRRNRSTDLTLISRAPVPLEGASTEFVVFRGGEGLRDQVAIIVGKPDFNGVVPVRLHSACLTGDLFGSLKCDCGDQLRGTVQFMAENGGGVLLYLDQEGRGNGLSNKIRAYSLQASGFDTYEADEVLGFDLDQRRFDFAADMLRQLGVKNVKLLTNNPEKIAAIIRAGLNIVAHERVIGRPTAENVHYLTSKRDRAGHLIDIDAMSARLNSYE